MTVRNTRDYLAWTIGNRDSMHRKVFHTRYLAHGNSKDEARGRRIHKNNSRRIVRNMEDELCGQKGEKSQNKA